MKKALILLFLFFATIITDTTAQATKLFPSDSEDASNFGRLVLTHDDYILVGGYGSGEEKVYVFKKTVDGWEEEAILKLIDSPPTNCFGCSLAAYGDYILVGAPGDDEHEIDAGAVYVFKKEGDQWIEKTKIIPSDIKSGQGFGGVHLHGDYAIIGSALDDINNIENSGSAYIFKRQGEDWIEQAKLIPFDPTDQALFGLRVSVNEEFAFVGSTRSFNADGVRTGAVYVYKRSGSEWVAQSKLTPSDGVEIDVFSNPIVSGNSLLVGNSNSPIYNGIGKGSGYVYSRDGDDWVQTDKLIPNEDLEGDLQLQGVGFSGEYVALASSNSPDSAPVHLYKKNESENSWNKVNILFESALINERYGHDLSLSDDYLVVGAHFAYYYHSDTDSTHTGAVYVYDLNTLVSDKEVLRRENQIVSSPNPATNQLQIKISNESPMVVNQLQLFDMSGRLLKSEAVNSASQNEHNLEFDTSTLPSGIYIIRVESGEEIYQEKFIKI